VHEVTTNGEKKFFSREGLNEQGRRKKEFFAVFADVEEYDKPLIITFLTFARLIDDVLIPFEEKKPFFIDGAPVKREKIRRLKILRQKEHFGKLFGELHYKLRHGDTARQKLYGEQYYIRMEAIFRSGCEDVTSQVIKAFDTKIKPNLKDYLPKREELIQAAATFFWEGIKKLSGN